MNCHKKVDNIIPINAAVRKNLIKTEELCNTCQHLIDCDFLPCHDCEMSEMEHCDDSEEHYICKCDCIAEGEPCPFYIEH